MPSLLSFRGGASSGGRVGASEKQKRNRPGAHGGKMAALKEKSTARRGVVDKKNFKSVTKQGMEEEFTNHESLPSLERAYTEFVEMYPYFVETLVVDDIRAEEYGHLQESGHVCLDYCGQGLFSYLQQDMDKFSSSFGLAYISASLPTHALYGGADEGTAEFDIRKRIMRFLNIHESEYRMVFTASRGSAFKLLAESYPFHLNKRLLTLYDYESEAVNWMEEAAQKKGANVISASFRCPSLRICATDLKKQILEKKKKKETAKGLFVFPVQSRVTGTKYSYQWMSQAQENGWHVLLDASSLGPKDMDSLGISLFQPDFIISSFYKVFGSDPTGFGCLFIKNTAIQCLHNSSAARGVGMVRVVPLPCLSSPSRSFEVTPAEKQQICEIEEEDEEAQTLRRQWKKVHNDFASLPSFSGPVAVLYEDEKWRVPAAYLAGLKETPVEIEAGDSLDRVYQLGAGSSSVPGNGISFDSGFDEHGFSNNANEVVKMTAIGKACQSRDLSISYQDIYQGEEEGGIEREDLMQTIDQIRESYDCSDSLKRTEGSECVQESMIHLKKEMGVEAGETKAIRYKIDLDSVQRIAMKESRCISQVRTSTVHTYNEKSQIGKDFLESELLEKEVNSGVQEYAVEENTEIPQDPSALYGNDQESPINLDVPENEVLDHEIDSDVTKTGLRKDSLFHGSILSSALSGQDECRRSTFQDHDDNSDIDYSNLVPERGFANDASASRITALSNNMKDLQCRNEIEDDSLSFLEEASSSGGWKQVNEDSFLQNLGDYCREQTEKAAEDDSGRGDAFLSSSTTGIEGSHSHSTAQKWDDLHQDKESSGYQNVEQMDQDVEKRKGYKGLDQDGKEKKEGPSSDEGCKGSMESEVLRRVIPGENSSFGEKDVSDPDSVYSAQRVNFIREGRKESHIPQSCTEDRISTAERTYILDQQIYQEIEPYENMCGGAEADAQLSSFAGHGGDYSITGGEHVSSAASYFENQGNQSFVESDEDPSEHEDEQSIESDYDDIPLMIRKEPEILCRGLNHADTLGLNKTNTRLRYLINWLIRSMLRLRHPGPDDAVPLVQIYGPKVKYERGASVAFNLFDWNGLLLQPILVQTLADRNNISLGIASLHHIRFSENSSEWLGLSEPNRSSNVGTPGSEGQNEGGAKASIQVLTAALGFITNFEDVYRLWAFVAKFLDADFVSKEVWRYRSLNQETVVVGM